MNKDALFATLIGLAIGVVLTGIILVGPGIAKSLPQFKGGISFTKIVLPKISFPQKKIIPSPTATVQEVRHVVAIDSPLPESIESEEQVLVSGSTTKDSLVIIQGKSNDAVIQANGDGKYAGKITLTEGKNDITVTSYIGKNRTAQQVTVYYTPGEW